MRIKHQHLRIKFDTLQKRVFSKESYKAVQTEPYGIKPELTVKTKKKKKLYVL